MTNVEEINRERLTRWKVLLNRKHCTAQLIIGFGLDHNLGDVLVLSTEEKSDQQILDILLSIASKLQQKITQQN